MASVHISSNSQLTYTRSGQNDLFHGFLEDAAIDQLCQV